MNMYYTWGTENFTLFKQANVEYGNQTWHNLLAAVKTGFKCETFLMASSCFCFYQSLYAENLVDWHPLWEFFDQCGQYQSRALLKKPRLDLHILLKVHQSPSRLAHSFSILLDQKPLIAHSIHLPKWPLKGKQSQGETAKSRSCSVAIPNPPTFKLWPAINLSWLYSVLPTSHLMQTIHVLALTWKK